MWLWTEAWATIPATPSTAPNIPSSTPRRRGREEAVFDLVGRFCESGDIIQPEVSLPGSTCRGDRVAVCTTGAYNYSMASNYNRIPRPPVVMLRRGESRVAVRRETIEDLAALDE